MPALVVPAVLLFALQFPQLALQSTNPLVASLVSLGASLLMLAALPFFQAGMVGMADDALDGDSSLGAFVDYGRSNYVQMLVAYLLVLAVNLVLGVVVAVVVFGTVLFGLVPVGPVVLALVAVVGLVAALAYVAFAFVVQFYGQAVVLEGRSGVDALTRSYGVVRSNLAATAGYTLVAFVVGGGIGLLFGGLSLLTTPEAAAAYGLPVLSTGGVVAVAAVLTLVGAVVSTFFVVYSVAFYRQVTTEASPMSTAAR
ncbi:hypothetical protein K933_16247 [Candidatus Halobonum tyrrellensis G22]|uniref:DUF7847 domain-containing protein n=1 Tax=Candidatus Halobonum tyrrellensis G22 TaxID=1324957 RepID=V4H8N8_9EURY|nr:hypothetical protein K933_16247 [Candidatus Halobonum tyrrellensis G22]